MTVVLKIVTHYVEFFCVVRDSHWNHLVFGHIRWLTRAHRLQGLFKLLDAHEKVKHMYTNTFNAAKSLAILYAHSRRGGFLEKPAMYCVKEKFPLLIDSVIGVLWSWYPCARQTLVFVYAPRVFKLHVSSLLARWKLYSGSQSRAKIGAIDVYSPMAPNLSSSA